jgi:hypothetical protein
MLQVFFSIADALYLTGEAKLSGSTWDDKRDLVSKDRFRPTQERQPASRIL